MDRPVQTHPSEETLNAYLDQVLDSEARKEVEAHFVHCAHCAARLEELQSLFAAIAGLEDLSLGRDLSPAVLAALRPPRIHFQALRWAAVIQMLTATLLIVLAWPRVLQVVETLDFEYLQVWVTSNAVELFQALSSLGHSVWEYGSTLTGPLLQMMPAIQQVYLPRSTWLVLITSVTALWAVGNGLLLPTRSAELHGASRRERDGER